MKLRRGGARAGAGICRQLLSPSKDFCLGSPEDSEETLQEGAWASEPVTLNFGSGLERTLTSRLENLDNALIYPNPQVVSLADG
jgi:hypothetical protein